MAKLHLRRSLRESRYPCARHRPSRQTNSGPMLSMAALEAASEGRSRQESRRGEMKHVAWSPQRLECHLRKHISFYSFIYWRKPITQTGPTIRSFCAKKTAFGASLREC